MIKETKTFTEEEVREIMNRQMEQQAFMINLQTGLGIVFANGKNWGMTEGQLNAINRLYTIFMAPPQPPQQPEPTSEPDPGTD